MLLFFSLCCVGVAIAGFSAFAIFWPLTLVHIRDRHPSVAAHLGTGAFLKPIALRWLLAGDYRQNRDNSLSGLATPARIAFFTMSAGLIAAGLLWLASLAV